MWIGVAVVVVIAGGVVSGALMSGSEREKSPTAKTPAVASLPTVELLRFDDSRGEWVFKATIDGLQGHPAPKVDHTIPRSGGSVVLVAVNCGGWPLEAKLERSGATEVFYGATIEDATAVRYPRARGDSAVVRTRRLAGLPLRWFAVRLRAGTVADASNRIVALDARGRKLGSQHYPSAEGMTPAFDGLWERRNPEGSIPDCG